jgi:Ca2+-binding EF-hand superfamily protein
VAALCAVLYTVAVAPRVAHTPSPTTILLETPESLEDVVAEDFLAATSKGSGVFSKSENPRIHPKKHAKRALPSAVDGASKVSKALAAATPHTTKLKGTPHSTTATLEASGAASEGVEEDPDMSFKLATAFFMCIVCVILLTVFFESQKGRVKAWVAGGRLEATVDAMFGELTVLGFIGLIAFAMQKAGLLTAVSKMVFSEGDPKENAERVPEMVETLHIQVFFIMLTFIAEVVFLIVMGKALEAKWAFAEEIIADHGENTRFGASYALLRDRLVSTESETDTWCTLPSWPLRRGDREVDYNIDFLALRAEFVHPRVGLHTKNQAHTDDEFDFSEYMACMLGKLLADVVSVSSIMWLSLMAAAAVFYTLLLVSGVNLKFLTITIGVVGYFMVFVSYTLCCKLRWVRKQLVCRQKLLACIDSRYGVGPDEEQVSKVPKEEVQGITTASNVHSQGEGSSGADGDGKKKKEKDAPDEDDLRDGTEAEDETTALKGNLKAPLLPIDAKGDDEKKDDTAADEISLAAASPAHHNSCKETRTMVPDIGARPLFEEAEQVIERSWLEKLLIGEELPNKHEALFWFDRLGPTFNKMFIQLVLVSTAIYISLVSLTFKYFVHDGLAVAIIAGVVLSMPPLTNFVLMTFMMGDTVLCTNVEMLIDTKEVQKVIFSQRTAKMMRLIGIINELRKKAQILQAATEMKSNKDPTGDDVVVDLRSSREEIEAIASSIDSKRRKEIVDIFEYYDDDDSGELDVEELLKFVHSLGLNAGPQEAQALMDALDSDGNGTIDLEEFIAWMAATESAAQKEETLSEAADRMFSLFDLDGDGELTLDEFSDKMHDFGLKLSEDEISMMMRELDSDSTGTIDAADFLSLFERHGFEP